MNSLKDFRVVVLALDKIMLTISSSLKNPFRIDFFSASSDSCVARAFSARILYAFMG
jgi:hypothetical protein